jgi:hypothetical protein
VTANLEVWFDRTWDSRNGLVLNPLANRSPYHGAALHEPRAPPRRFAAGRALVPRVTSNINCEAPGGLPVAHQTLTTLISTLGCRLTPHDLGLAPACC